MIFYFSGTGNSKHVADKIAKSTGESMVYVTENIIGEAMDYPIGANERIGFVFPVYWYSIPTLVEKFIVHLKLSGYQNQYVYAVATFGIAGGNVMDRLIRILKRKQVQLNGLFGVKMVDNYVVGYNVISPDKQRIVLTKAEVEIDKIVAMIEGQIKAKYISRGMLAFVTPITGGAYRITKHNKFYTSPKCNGCGLCEQSCPCNAIHMIDNKPEWAGDCTFCLKCLHGCKQRAIQYGKFTLKRGRYQFHKIV